MFTDKQIRRFRKVIKFIIAEPRRFNMVAGVEYASAHRDTQLETPPCGTACCIGGAAFIVGQRIKLDMPVRLGWNPVAEYAMEYLGLDRGQRERLFYTAYWPATFKTAYEQSRSAQERAYVGAARFEHFIATNGAE
jgi:hypothetical protein